MEKSEHILLQHFVLNSLEKSYSIYEHNLRELKVQFSELSVHDYRVSMRRFMALSDLMNKFIPLKYFTEIRSLFKSQLKILNPLRDVQVQVLRLQKDIYLNPALISFYMKLLKDEQDYINQTRSFFENYSIDEVDGLMFFINLSLKDKFAKEEFDFSWVLRVSKELFENLEERKNAVDTNDLNTVHKLRIAFKKYRYLIEIIADYIEYPKELLKKIKHIQTTLGEIQDIRVYFDNLAIFVSELEPDVKELYKPTIQSLLKSRSELLYELSEVLINISELWREEYFRIKY